MTWPKVDTDMHESDGPCDILHCAGTGYLNIVQTRRHIHPTNSSEDFDEEYVMRVCGRHFHPDYNTIYTGQPLNKRIKIGKGVMTTNKEEVPQ